MLEMVLAIDSDGLNLPMPLGSPDVTVLSCEALFFLMIEMFVEILCRQMEAGGGVRLGVSVLTAFLKLFDVLDGFEHDRVDVDLLRRDRLLFGFYLARADAGADARVEQRVGRGRGRLALLVVAAGRGARIDERVELVDERKAVLVRRRRRRRHVRVLRRMAVMMMVMMTGAVRHGRGHARADARLLILGVATQLRRAVGGRAVRALIVAVLGHRAVLIARYVRCVRVGQICFVRHDDVDPFLTAAAAACELSQGVLMMILVVVVVVVVVIVLVDQLICSISSRCVCLAFCVFCYCFSFFALFSFG